MTHQRRGTTEQGRWAETAAARHLQQAGLGLWDRNYRCRCGEIDLVMQEGAVLVFVEVRYRRSSDFGSGAESVHAAKQQRIIRAAQHYLQMHPQRARGACRFDVVIVSGTDAAAGLEWIRDAFQA